MDEGTADFRIQLTYDGPMAHGRALADQGEARGALVELEPAASGDRVLVHIGVVYDPNATDGPTSLSAALDVMETLTTLATELGLRVYSGEPVDLDAQRRVRYRTPKPPPSPLQKPG